MSTTTPLSDRGNNNNNNNNHTTLSDSESYDSAVVVTHDDAAVPELKDEAANAAKAVQIVSIGGEKEKFAFSFDKEKVKSILDQVPLGTKVAVLSVVGAFRTGKSFLLSWFLRYLHHLETNDKQDKQTISTKPWYKQFDSLGNDGFEWKGGSERNTTGIWMWSKPFLLSKGKQPMALLLVDTQGMFDHETTMALTASIFGFSTLLSSFQIYNVDKRIQEDNLQHLALFAEYARIAVTQDTSKQQGESNTAVEAPFQSMEFLVRDWQHFEDEESVTTMANSMTEYLAKVLEDKDAADLKDTRTQILACFDKVTCYGLCHPGFAVTKKKFTGDVNAIEELFVRLLDHYCQRVFGAVEPKKIHGRTLTAMELLTYIEAYADLFASGAKFPQAVTMLEATASANNTNAVQKGLVEYKERMDRVAGPHCSNYLKPEELEEEHAAAVAASLRAFGDIANFGSEKAIAAAKRSLQEKIHESHEMYESLNDGRNPLKGIELYLIAFLVALGAFLVEKFLNFTCAPHATVCQVGSELASHAYAVVFCFMAIIVATRFQQVKEHVGRMCQALDVVLGGNASGGGNRVGKPKTE